MQVQIHREGIEALAFAFFPWCLLGKKMSGEKRFVKLGMSYFAPFLLRSLRSFPEYPFQILGTAIGLC